LPAFDRIQSSMPSGAVRLCLDNRFLNQQGNPL
jgi:hypothetical protein